MFYTHLQSRGVFACYCHVFGEVLSVGILVLDPEEPLESQVLLVYPTDKTHAFKVLLREGMEAFNSKVELLLI